MAHSNIYHICDLLECMEGQVLQIQSCRISVTQGNNMIYKRALVRIQY